MKTMEEVWKDISLSGLHEKPTREDGSTTFQGIVLQDFLARPFTHPSSNPPDIDNPLLGSSSSTLAPPTTALSLNSGPEFAQLDALATFPTPSKNSDYHRFQTHHCFTNAASISFMADTPKTAFDAFGSPPALPSLCNKKRIAPESEENSGDRRHKRMIKNRESAARSRARKQAWSYPSQTSDPFLSLPIE